MARNTVIVSVLADTKKFSSGMKGANSSLGKIAKIGALAVAAVGTVAVALGTKAVKSASKLEQAMGGLEAVFKGQFGTMDRFASKAASSVGLAENEYAELATVLGAQLKNMGVSTDKLAGQTNDLVGLGADLAAQFGGSTSEAVAALSSLLRGERDPIERYGVSINEAAVKAKLAEMGLSGLSGEAEKNAKLQATLALLTDQTADAQGAFAREADTLAGAQQRVAAATENVYSKIGTALLPAISAAVGAFGTLFAKLVESEGFDNFVAGLGNVAENVAAFITAIAEGKNPLGGFAGQLLEIASYFSPIGIALRVLEPLLPPLAAAFSDLGNTLVTAIAPLLPVLADAFAQIGAALVPVVGLVIEVATMLIEALAPAIGELVPIIALLIPPIVELASAVIPPLIGALRLLLQAFGPIIETVVSVLVPVIQSIVDGLTGLLDFLIGVFTGDWDRAWKGLQKSTKAIWDTIVSVISGVVQIILSILTQWWQSIVQMGSQLTNGLARALVDGWRGIQSWFQSLPGVILGFFSGVGSWLLDVGRNLIQGLGDGIAAMGQWVLDQIGNVINGAIGWAKDLLGIHSPSRVFRDFGRNVGRGLADGIADMGRGVRDAAGGLANAVTGGFGDPTLAIAGLDTGGTAAGRTGSGNTYNIYVNAIAPSPEVGRAIAESLSEFERLGGIR